MFLTGKEEIESMVSQIRTISRSTDLAGRPRIICFPLYSSLDQKKQMEVFQSSMENTRRVIVATNIAETSITITGIKFVIDTGVVKLRSFDAGTSMDSLKVTKISQAQAWQRTGRAGRQSDGICYRTYTAREMESFDKMTTPEILRCNLATAMLQLLAININIETFDFMDKPPKESIDAAFKQLKQLGAIRTIVNPQLTETGKKMSRFPLDPPFSKILIASTNFQCTSEILDLVSVLSTESVYCEPSQNNRDQAITQHSKLQIRNGDHLTLLNIFTQFQKSDRKKIWCQEHFLNHRNLSYAAKVREQLVEICKLLGIATEKTSPKIDADSVSCSNNSFHFQLVLIAFAFVSIVDLQVPYYRLLQQHC